MSKVKFPKIGEIRFFMDKPVIIKDIIDKFQFVKVSYLDRETTFYVDVKSLTLKPNKN